MLMYAYKVVKDGDGFIFLVLSYFQLQSIRKSECPKELEPADRRSSVHVNLIRREENCPVSPLFFLNYMYVFMVHTSA